ncbi:MAG TPA: hypothetical protein VIX82_13445 [Solirubrobacteraceae bacterium]
MAGLALAAAIAGCGSSAKNVPTLAQLPLVNGAAIVAHVRQCDRGANVYCAIELVVVDNHYQSSTALVASEKRALKQRGWTRAGPDTSEEHAADSPGRKFRVTYATALGELTGIELGWIQRPRTITLALSRGMFNRVPTMAVMLEVSVT